MKVIQKVCEVSGEGLESLIGKKVILFCINYIYHGTLVGVNTTCVKLESPSIIYSTGDFQDKAYADIQSLCVENIYVQTAAIESFGLGK
jgi:hypothetical protein